MPQVKFQEITAKRDGESSESIRARVIYARQRQEKRFDGNVRITCNARMQAGKSNSTVSLAKNRKTCCEWG